MEHRGRLGPPLDLRLIDAFGEMLVDARGPRLAPPVRRPGTPGLAMRSGTTWHGYPADDHANRDPGLPAVSREKPRASP